MRVCHAFTQSFPPKQVARESGPPHMKSFVTRVSVGEFVGEGEGKSKKISKKNAAIAVLEELKKLPPLPTVERVKPRIKKKTKSIVRVRMCLKEEGISIARRQLGVWKVGERGGVLACTHTRLHESLQGRLVPLPGAPGQTGAGPGGGPRCGPCEELRSSAGRGAPAACLAPAARF